MNVFSDARPATVCRARLHRDALYISIRPGLAPFALVLSLNLIGDDLTEHLDPRGRAER